MKFFTFWEDFVSSVFLLWLIVHIAFFSIYVMEWKCNGNISETCLETRKMIELTFLIKVSKYQKTFLSLIPPKSKPKNFSISANEKNYCTNKGLFNTIKCFNFFYSTPRLWIEDKKKSFKIYWPLGRSNSYNRIPF